LKADNNYISGFSLILIVLMNISCSTDSKMERRLTALERRVAALETGPNEASRASDSDILLANNPEKIATNGQNPEIKFNEMEFDFGTINEGEIVNHVFKFTNVGKAPLLIDKATASCGCTVPDWPKKPIGVGEIGEIKVRFDSKNKPNQQIKTVTISANTEPSLTRLRIKGFVTPENQQAAGPVKN